MAACRACESTGSTAVGRRHRATPEHDLSKQKVVNAWSAALKAQAGAVAASHSQPSHHSF